MLTDIRIKGIFLLGYRFPKTVANKRNKFIKKMVMAMKVTIADVASKAGVSKTTVSRVLNGNFSHTTEATKQRILNAAKELDYSPNALAKSLKSMKTNIIGMVLSNLKNPFWTTVLEGVEDTCRELGYNLMICNSNEDPTVEEQFIKEFQMRQVDGIVLHPTAQNNHIYQKLADSKLPLVFINRRVGDLSALNVVMDNVKGAKTAVDHLLKNGREKVAVVLYDNRFVSPWRERKEGYQKALLANNFMPEDFLVLEVDQQKGNVKKETIQFLKENPEIDAIFSTNNMLTMEVIEAIKEMGLEIPVDIGIVSYDETVWARHLTPPLTTIWQPGYEMGRLAARNLINSIEDPSFQTGQTIILEPQLIVRESCGNIKSKV
ncbi:LacI family DNA-binding transcriptional regulator [Sediminibacillus massiliensis]|uniref:LacI family DNA-binding transcriptional regulator n=1 Tax=Sediminibacillus massiliensis TaxID=1926277 RepID=UPI001FE616EE|nr:LacI family DNA-binding transcriptional regulator [Sediminibacillus massiliensis]